MQSQSDPYFIIFQKRRRKVEQFHRNRREELFNKSRRIFEDSGEDEKQEGNSQSNMQDDDNELFSIQPNEIKEKIESTSLEQQSIEEKIEEVGRKNKNYNKKNNYKKKAQAYKYGKLIQIPAWMTIVPEELHKFYVMARPSGSQGILIFKQNWVKAYDKFGRKIDVIKEGEKDNQNVYKIKKICQNLEGTVLQIVFAKEGNIFYVTDLISWKNNIMTTENFEFRYAWLISNSQNQLLKLNHLNLHITIAQYFLLENQENLKKVYFDNFGYEKQGLLFIHKQSPYIHGLNENTMIWKDFQTSKYPIDESQIQIANQQIRVENKYIYGLGKLAKNGNIYSLDGYKLGHINPSQIIGNPQGYIKFRVANISFKGFQPKNQQHNHSNMDIEHSTKNMNLILNNFEIINYKKYGKLRADSLSRLIFQYRMRNDPLTIQQIAARIPNNQ